MNKGPVIGGRHYLDEERALELYNKGMCDQEIADALGGKYSTVGGWRRKKKLPAHRKPNYRERTTAISKLSLEAREAREAGMNYGTYKARQHDAISTSRTAWQRRAK